MRVLIVDDEPPALAGLRALLAAHADVEIVGEAAGGREAVRAIRALAPDVVFLDVQMPEVDGFAVVDALLGDAGPIPAMIFVTAYDAFAVRAFDVRAIDYLLKPVADERFARALVRARETLARAHDGELEQQLRALLDERARSRPSEPARDRPAYAARLLVRIGARDVLVGVGEVDWIRADDYCAVLNIGGRRHVIRETLGSLESRLDPAAFTRIHRSAIVNLSRVTALHRHGMGGLSLVLSDGTRLPVSRSRRARVVAALGASR